ncbi:MAG: CoA transferase, partial [Paralcaligenes sp.]
MAVGAIEKRFYLNFVRGLGLEPDALPTREDMVRHGELAARFQQRFLGRSMVQWAEHFANLEACVTPVLTLREAQAHLVNLAAFAAPTTHNALNVPRASPHLTSLS